jgi:Amiloride-sensitive sodium channel
MLISDTHGIDICGPQQFPCYVNTKSSINNEMFASCNCLPTCSSITFESEIAVAQLDKSALPSRYRNQEAGVQYSQVTIYIKDNQLIPVKRTELYGMIDFLANCGGLLGLFFGVSIISFLEIVYFCTVRLYFNMRREAINGRQQLEVMEDPQTVRINIRLRSLVAEYFNKTTIQGISQVFNSKSSPVERTWWAVVVIVSVFCCGHLVSSIFGRFDQSPVILSHANEETHISEVFGPNVVHFNEDFKTFF